MLVLRRTILCFLTFFSGCFCKNPIENVALGKSCRQDSKNSQKHNCYHAVDGNTEGLYEFPPYGCMHSDFQSLNPWWEVNLGRMYPVYSITVWAREGYLSRMTGSVITVDGHHCYTFSSPPESRKININCSSGVINGSVVRISKQASSKDPKGHHTINLCEVQVWSCSGRFWGTQCENKCGRCSNGGICDKVTGHCSACEKGFFGPSCVTLCGQCGKGQVCDNVTGHCQTCKTGWEKPDCLKENVALGKSCRQDSKNSQKHNCYHAVDGSTEGLYKFPPYGCMHSDFQSLNPWWEVNLGRTYPVYSITVWAREGYLCRMTGSVITVDGKHCYTFSSRPKSREININCTSGVINGSVVRISKHVSKRHPKGHHTLNLCEVQVWICDDGNREQNCPIPCGNCADDMPCDPVTGHCPSCKPGWKMPDCLKTCEEGFFGPTCITPCGQCANGQACDKVTGHCLSCKNGWKMPDCQKACDNSTYGQNCTSVCVHCAGGQACDPVTGHCLSCKLGRKLPDCQTACDNGTYGQNCSVRCGHCANGVACDPVTGHCTSCLPGWNPPHCQQAELLNAQSRDDGTDRQNFSLTCGNCADGMTCNPVTGHCPSCKPGWKMPDCLKSCDNSTYGQNCTSVCGHCTGGQACDPVTGHCLSCDLGWKPPDCQTECEAGKYGEACQEDCGPGCENTDCDAFFGHCDCMPGWLPPHCQLACEKNTYGQNCTSVCGHCGGGQACNPVTGHCLSCELGWKPHDCQTVCEAGKYGEDCRKDCGPGCINNVCEAFFGHCDCLPGWMPPHCQLACDNGTYGQNCSMTCKDCLAGQVCDPVTGHCSLFKPGWRSDVHTMSNDADSAKFRPRCENCEYGQTCDPVTGHCPVCKPGWKPPDCQQECDSGKYGLHCTQSCSPNCGGELGCNKVTGACTCLPGWKPPMCIQACDNGTFGPDCSLQCGQCGNNLTCDKVNGVCLSCEHGWKLPYCHIGSPLKDPVKGEEDAIKMGGINYWVIGGIVTAVVLMLCLIIWMLSWGKKIKRAQTTQSDKGQNNIYEVTKDSEDTYDNLKSW